MDAPTIFLVGFIAIFLGFVSDYLFRRFKAPDVLILIGFGILLAPSLTGILNESIVSKITSLTPYVAALALSVIMFQAGMGLKIREVFTSFSWALIQTVLAFVVSALLVSIVCVVGLGWGLGTSLLLGSILGGTSGAIVIPLIGGLGSVSPRMKVILTLEAAITDVLVIVVAMSIMGVMSSGDASIGKAIGSILSAFLVSGFIGLVGGFIWLEILSRYMAGQPFSYMVTLAVLLGVYAVTEMLVNGTGGGAIAALLFGLTLANGGELAGFFKFKVKDYVCDENISKLHNEISFFVRTFFFIYLGLVVTTIAIALNNVLIGIAVCVAIILGRLMTTQIIGRYIAPSKVDRDSLLFMMPRGLSAAVLASIPLALGVVDVEVGGAILGTVTIVILLSTAFASAGAYYIDRESKKEKENQTPTE